MKKTVCFLFFLVFIFNFAIISVSAFSTGDEPITVEDAIKEHELIYEVTLEKNRYYFLMPDGKNGKKSQDGANNYEIGDYVSSWYNSYTNSAYIHWQDSGIVDTEYPGYVMIKTDCDNIYYADIPLDVTQFTIDNGLDYYSDKNLEQYARRTGNIPCEYYDAGESALYPDGLPNFNDMIYVIDPDEKVWSEDGTSIVGLEVGEWYYYYGDGCYGAVENGDSSNCLRDDHEHFLLGDVDMDHELTIMDAAIIQKMLAKLVDKSMINTDIADMDKDGEVSVVDATIIQKKLANLA